MEKQYRRCCVFGWNKPAVQRFSIFGIDSYRFIVEPVIFWRADDGSPNVGVINEARLEEEEDCREKSIPDSSHNAQFEQHKKIIRWNSNFFPATHGYNNEFP
jgi:hypothetical protein